MVLIGLVWVLFDLFGIYLWLFFLSWLLCFVQVVLIFQMPSVVKFVNHKGAEHLAVTLQPDVTPVTHVCPLMSTHENLFVYITDMPGQSSGGAECAFIPHR